MIIDDEEKTGYLSINIGESGDDLVLNQVNDIIVIDKLQAEKLINALQNWVDGGKVD